MTRKGIRSLALAVTLSLVSLVAVSAHVVPAIAASGLLELKEAVHKLPAETYGPLLVGTFVSGVVGYASIWFLLRFLRTHSTGIFIGYRLIVGSLILAGLASHYISAAI